MPKKIISIILCTTLILTMLVGCTGASISAVDTKSLVELSRQNLNKTIKNYADTSVVLIDYLRTANNNLAINKARNVSITESKDAKEFFTTVSSVAPRDVKASDAVLLACGVCTFVDTCAIAAELEAARSAIDASIKEQLGKAVAEDIIDTVSYAINETIKDGQVRLEGIIRDVAVKFALPKGFSAYDDAKHGLIYSDGVGFVEITYSLMEEEISDEYYLALIENLNNVFGGIEIIDTFVDKKDLYSKFVVLFESGTQEGTNINWAQYVFAGDQVVQILYTLDIDAKEEDFYKVGDFFDSFDLVA